MKLNQYEQNIGTFSDEELEKHALSNLQFGLKHRNKPELWDASCRMAKIIREEQEAREQVRNYAARVRSGMQARAA